MNKKITLLFFAAIISISVSAQSFSALYTFDSIKTTSGTTDPSFVPTATGVTFGSFSATGTPPNSLAAARFDFSDWATGSIGGVNDTLFSGMTGTVSTAEYYEVTLSPMLTYSLDLDTIRFTFERSGTGVRTYAVRSSLDAYASNLTAIYVAPNTNVDVQTGNIFFLKKDITSLQTRNNIILSAGGFTGLITPVTFRFYAWNSEAASGTFSIDNVRFIGSASTATAISEKKLNAISVFPNPSINGMFTIDAGAYYGKTTVRVFNIIGKEILTKEFTSPSKQAIDLSSQANGSYFIRIQNENESIVKKIVISK